MGYYINRVEVDNKSLLDILNILQLSFPKSDKFTFDYLKWQYVLNPLGEVVGYNAYYQGCLAAHYVAMPIVMNIKGKERKGLLSLNTATHPEHRGKKLFSILAEKTYEYAAQHGFEFVVGVANENSTHGFLKNLKFELVSPLLTKVGIGTSLFQDIPVCFRVWDKEQLKWRLSNPSNKYDYKNGLVYSGMSIQGVKAIMGYIPEDVAGDLDDNLTGKIHCRPLNLYIGLGGNLSKGIYCEVPSFIKRSPLNLIFRDLSGNLPKFSKDDFFFQLIDFDVL